MSGFVAISEAGMGNLQSRLEGVQKLSRDLRPVWPEIGGWWGGREMRVFAAGQGGWAPLDRDTHRGTGILIKTGQLRRALANPNPIQAAPTSAIFGARGRAGWYGVFHQNGRGVPMRKPVPEVNGAEVGQVEKILAIHFERALAA
jgi:hypothetical protein